MDQHAEHASTFETWWTQDLESAYQRWVSKKPSQPVDTSPELLRFFAEESGLKPRWAQ